MTKVDFFCKCCSVVLSDLTLHSAVCKFDSVFGHIMLSSTIQYKIQFLSPFFLYYAETRERVRRTLRLVKLRNLSVVHMLSCVALR